MSNEIPSFLKRKDDALLFNKPDHELIFYLPEEYFKYSIAEPYGAYISMLGICNYTIVNLKTGKNNGLHPFRFPTVILCKPRSIEKLKGVKLTKDIEASDYRLLHFQDDDEVITSTKVPQIIENVNLFFKLFTITAHIPTTISYDELQDLFVENINLNGSDYGLNMQMFGFVISEICRDPDDLSKPFRLAKNKTMNQYRPISAKLIPNYVSPFVSITSENFDKSIMAAITMDQDQESPLEKVLSQ